MVSRRHKIHFACYDEGMPLLWAGQQPLWNRSTHWKHKAASRQQLMLCRQSVDQCCSCLVTAKYATHYSVSVFVHYRLQDLTNVFSCWQAAGYGDAQYFQWRQSTDSLPSISGGDWDLDLHLRLLLMKAISADLLRLSRRLFRRDQVSKLSNSAALESALLAGLIRYVSSAYLHMPLPGVTAFKSAALTTYMMQVRQLNLE